MNLQLIGCSHHQASVSVRERLAFSPSQVEDFLDLFYSRFQESEAVLLSTCNRTEFYAAAQNSEFCSSGHQKSQENETKTAFLPS